MNEKRRKTKTKTLIINKRKWKKDVATKCRSDKYCPFWRCVWFLCYCIRPTYCRLGLIFRTETEDETKKNTKKKTKKKNLLFLKKKRQTQTKSKWVDIFFHPFFFLFKIFPTELWSQHFGKRTFKKSET